MSLTPARQALLITRPDHDTTTRYLYHWSKLVLREAAHRKLVFTDLKGNQATKDNFEELLKERKPHLIFFNGHGSETTITGYNNEILVEQGENEHILSKTLVYARSCNSAKKLGPACVTKGATTFIGYTNKFMFAYSQSCTSQPEQDELARLFLEPSNLVPLSLLQGYSTWQAHTKALQSMVNNIRYMTSHKASLNQQAAAPYLWNNFTSQILLGEKKATIYHKKSFPKVSICIPVRQINNYLREHLPRFLELNYPNFEILIHVDQKEPREGWDKVRIIYEPEVILPPQKRNRLVGEASGEIIAFIDDDAYPNTEWLNKAIPWFEDEKTVAAVGGPNLTHPKDNLWQRVGGWVLSCRFGSAGAGLSRVEKVPKARGQELDDWPSVNLIVRKEDFVKVGGFKPEFYTGEDTKLCLDLVNLGKRIVYEPEAVVYHHRRAIFWPHLKQVGTYGRHRGYFAKILPETSRRLGYFLPTLFVIGLIVGPLLGIIFPPLSFIYLLTLLIYFMLLLYSAHETYRKSRSIPESFLVIPAIFATHIWYGLTFAYGFLSKKYVGRGNY